VDRDFGPITLVLSSRRSPASSAPAAHIECYGTSRTIDIRQRDNTVRNLMSVCTRSSMVTPTKTTLRFEHLVISEEGCCGLRPQVPQIEDKDVQATIQLNNPSLQRSGFLGGGTTRSTSRPPGASRKSHARRDLARSEPIIYLI
jgi:hypothetical protein